jgi:steroid delta-isomerase
MGLFTVSGVSERCSVALSGVRCLRAVVLVAMVSSFTGCGSSPAPSASDLNAAYELALEETAAPTAHIYTEGSQTEEMALARLEAYFATMTVATVAEQTADVYAPEAWLYDNLAAIKGVDEIRRYFANAAGDVDKLSVEFLQTARSNEDYFVRWRMLISSARLAGGEPLISYGVSQFRFDDQGRVLLHRDFWDAGTGLYEYLPVLGALVTRVRGGLADHSGN